MARGRGRRTDYEWEGIGAGAAMFGSLQTTASVQELISIQIPATIMRIRGEFLAFLTTSAAANSVKAIGVGITLVSNEALAAGAASIPDPLSDLNADWMWHGFALLGRVSTTEDESAGLTSVRLEIDTKAMRKVKPNTSLVFVVSPLNLSGTETARAVIGARVLLGT